jgi:hypothetical protein
MIRLPKNWVIYAAFLPAVLILVGIGITTAKALWFAAITVSATYPANRDSNASVNDDYVHGLANRGIVKLPGYEPAPAAPVNAAAMK